MKNTVLKEFEAADAAGYWKAFLKRKVLSSLLNSGSVGLFLRLDGSEFHTLGAWKLKDLSPTDFRLNFGSFNNFSAEDRRVRDGE